MKNYITKSFTQKSPAWRVSQIRRAKAEKEQVEARRRKLLGLPVMGYSAGRDAAL